MLYTFSPMNEQDAHAIQRWQYESPYETYTMNASDPQAISELLDTRSPYYAVRDENAELVGFCAFGSSALIREVGEPRIFVEEKTIAVGLGLRPNLTGRGVGLSFVEAILGFARHTYRPEHFLLYVYTWNQRAISVYIRAGFSRGRIVTVESGRTFLEMRRAS
jgi:[ribosomal protein S18]-alanine N-acetyltransferase